MLPSPAFNSDVTRFTSCSSAVPWIISSLFIQIDSRVLIVDRRSCATAHNYKGHEWRQSRPLQDRLDRHDQCALPLLLARIISHVHPSHEETRFQTACASLPWTNLGHHPSSYHFGQADQSRAKQPCCSRQRHGCERHGKARTVAAKECRFIGGREQVFEIYDPSEGIRIVNQGKVRARVECAVSA